MMEQTSARCHCFIRVVNIGENRHTYLFSHLLENAQPFIQTRTTIGIDGGTIGLVITRFIDELERPASQTFPSNQQQCEVHDPHFQSLFAMKKPK